MVSSNAFAAVYHNREVILLCPVDLDVQRFLLLIPKRFIPVKIRTDLPYSRKFPF